MRVNRFTDRIRAFACRTGPGGAILPGSITRLILAAWLLSVTTAGISWSQDYGSLPPPTKTTIDTTLDAGESEATPPKRRLVKWNEYDGPISTLRVGFGFLVDVNTFFQDEDSEEQVSPENDVGLRDFRLLFKGRFKTKRKLSWTLGYMYDGAADEWRFRMTGLMVAVPELAGSFFVGRTKEGYSMIKVMVGYHGWTMERSTASDAFIPILADGIKYMGYLPKQHLSWNLGYYVDALSEKESFSTADHQLVGRLVWLPVLSDENKKVLHLGVMGRDFKPDDGQLGPKSRPEAYLSTFFVDTGKFDTDHANTVGYEAFYRSGPILFGTEYHWQIVDAPASGNPTFHGGDAAVAWNITGETRPYNAAGGFFEAVSPNKTVFEGGPGAWEAVLRMSYIDLDAGTLLGGRFWRVTPMVNWHMSDNLRLEAVYGYGILDRFDLKGATQFLQFRIQTSL